MISNPITLSIVMNRFRENWSSKCFSLMSVFVDCVPFLCSFIKNGTKFSRSLSQAQFNMERGKSSHKNRFLPLSQLGDRV